MIGPDVPSRIEQLCDRCVPGATRSRLGGWILRAHLGVTGRANSIWPADAVGTDMGSAVDEAIRWYRGIGIRPAFQIFDGRSADLTTELDRRGWSTVVGAGIMSAGIDELRLSDQSGHEGRVTSIVARPDGAFVDLIGNPGRLTELTESALPQSFATTANPDGEVVGGAMSMRDSDWLGVFSMKTIPEARRTGVATNLLRVLAEDGRGPGASKLWLQVRTGNAPARRLYRRVGFTRVHGYHYRILVD